MLLTTLCHPTPTSNLRFQTLIGCVTALFLMMLATSCGTRQPQPPAEPIPSPRFVIYTYGGNPSTSITVNWQTFSPLPGPPGVSVRTDAGTPPSHLVVGKTHTISGLEDRYLHRVHIDGLTPGSTVYLTPTDANGTPLPGAMEQKIRTIPEDDRPLRFVTGGDMGTSEEVRILLRHAAAQNPAFAAVGGDIAYANGNLQHADRWDTWMTYYTEEMVTPDGYQIPLLLAVGNHEVAGGYGKPLSEAPFFRGFFGQDPAKNHFARSFGRNLHFLILDSGHTASHEEQASWIREELQQHRDAAHTAAIYHVPLYPSHRDFLGTYSEQGRIHWAPVFDEMNLTVAFENHDHTYKRTHLLKHNQKTTDGSGTLYLGDGCWGRGARPVEYQERWYVKQSHAVQHFWTVDVTADALTYRAIDVENRVFDVYPEHHPDAAAARQVRAALPKIYLYPEDQIQCTPFSIRNGQWQGGSITVTVTNPFEAPVQIRLGDWKHKHIQAEEFPTAPILLAPGEQHTWSLNFHPRNGSSLPEHQSIVRLRLLATLNLPGGETSEFNTRITVPTRHE